jgi:hypothetical protein
MSEWNQGRVAHIIPTANHERFLIKVSFAEVLDKPPQLSVNGRQVTGSQRGPIGRFWRFDVDGLDPATEYELKLADANGSALCDPWPLRTLPRPEDAVEKLRILAYTCPGGFDGPPVHGKTTWLDMKARRELLARALSFEPDVLISNGDQIYWDIKTWLNKPIADYFKQQVWPRFGGQLDTSVPMLHPKNIKAFTAACDYQIPGLYGASLRSIPGFFLTDDHDLFENDEYHDGIASLPPDYYGLLGAEQTQDLYYPEFLPDPNRPDWLPGTGRAWAAPGTNISFGTLRYGTLFEAVLYDCRRYVNYKGDQAKILPQWVEDWLLERTAADDTAHLIHAPSLPFAYSSGKLGDWYPDLLDPETGRLVIYKSKPGWQTGWLHQHQRLIAALAAQKKRAPVVVQGDFHASSAGTIHRSADLKFDNPVHVITGGTLGTGDIAFPSAARGIDPTASELIGIDEVLPPTEKNGFSIIDVTPEKMVFRMFTWRPPEPIEAIATLDPMIVYEIPR